MRIAVLGTGVVGQTIGTKLVSLGHEVKMGSRTAGNENAAAWVQKTGEKATHGTFADAAAFGELVFNCINGAGTVAALTAAGEQNLKNKVLVDLSNPLDFSRGFPPTLTVVNTDSLGEQLQRLLPQTHIVKTLNTVTSDLMVAPQALAGGDHTMFMCGNDAGAKERVVDVLTSWFGWKDVLDLGDITMARGLEMSLALWVRIYGALQSPSFNVKIVRG